MNKDILHYTKARDAFALKGFEVEKDDDDFEDEQDEDEEEQD